MRRLERLAAWLGLRQASIRVDSSAAEPADQQDKLLGPGHRQENLLGRRQDRLLGTPASSRPHRFYLTTRTGLCVSIICLCISFGLTLLMWCSQIFDNSILKLVSIRNDLDLIFDLWRLPPTRPFLSVYIFNYTNADMALKGLELPRVQEIGPYVFREKMERINIKFHNNGTVSFQEKRAITFHPELSIGQMNDTVIIPNVPLLVFLDKMRMLDYLPQGGVSYLLPMFDVKSFQNITASDFIWGYEDNFYKVLRKMQSFIAGQDEPKFGFLSKRGGVHHSVVTMKTGNPDLDDVGTITVFDGSEKIGIWGNTDCDEIKGSDGSLFPGNKVHQKLPLYIYSHDMCRRLPIIFNKTTKTVDGFPVHKYNVPMNMFEFSPKNYANKCYKYNGDYPPNGSFYAGPCLKGKPIYVTFPHFWTGDERLQNSIHGLNPDPIKHESSFLLHERLGVCLRALTKFQMNIRVHKARYMPQYYEGIKEGTILPLAWMEYDSGPLPEHFKNIVHHLTFTVRTVQELLKWIFLLSFFLSVFFFYVQIKKLFFFSNFRNLL